MSRAPTSIAIVNGAPHHRPTSSSERSAGRSKSTKPGPGPAKLGVPHIGHLAPPASHESLDGQVLGTWSGWCSDLTVTATPMDAVDPARVVDTEMATWSDTQARAFLDAVASPHPKVVSEGLGHATVGITVDLYSHVLDGLQAQAAEQIGPVVFGLPEPNTIPPAGEFGGFAPLHSPPNSNKLALCRSLMPNSTLC